MRAAAALAAALLALALVALAVPVRARPVRCPVGQASYHQLRVAGFMLYRARRITEGRKCFQDAMNLYLARFSQVRADPAGARGSRAAGARKKLQEIAAAHERAARRSAEADDEGEDALERDPALGRPLASNVRQPGAHRSPGPEGGAPRPFWSGEAEREAVAAEYERQLKAQRSAGASGQVY